MGSLTLQYRSLQLACILLICMIANGSARAASVETLLMPGPVSRAHAKYEETCSNCHDRSLKRTQTSLCLDCHKEIRANLSEHRGYHGRMRNASIGECHACHTEHKGRSADIVRLDIPAFDHQETNFALEGAHQGLACAACHKTGAAWGKAASTCIGCHKADDVHRGQFTEACSKCHDTKSWTNAHFDHDKTDYPLTGAHQAISCNSCHIGGRYKDSPRTCNGCHATDDVHRGERGEQCGNCHSTKDWKTAKFDHLKETGFALIDAHAVIDCTNCHRTGKYKDKIPKDCYGCHRADDSHAGRFGEKCADCHAQDRWHPVTYDHAAKTHFALLGAHEKLSCHTCHTAPVATQKLGKDCASCHRVDDPHAGQVHGSCETCHGQNHWRSDLTFDHDLTKYPLLGMHRLVSCAQCHATLAFTHAPTQCYGCHAGNDIHKGGLGKKCETCHSTGGWALWTFDHGKQTGFALTGAHAKLDCADCHHQTPGTSKMSQECVGCHRQDDRHLGAYGTQCQRCHSTVTFKGGRAR
jgi:hypothetical protein